MSLKASPELCFGPSLRFYGGECLEWPSFSFSSVRLSVALMSTPGSAVRQDQITEQGSIAKLAKAIVLNHSQEGRDYTRAGQEFMVLANNELLKGDQERNLDDLCRFLNNSIAFSVRGRKSSD